MTISWFFKSLDLDFSILGTKGIQTEKLIESLHRDFAGTNDDCRIIIDPMFSIPIKTGVQNFQLDAIVLKDNMIAIIELKDHEGIIRANYSKGAIWTVDTGKSPYEVKSSNPYEQAALKRLGLCVFLDQHFFGDSNPSKNLDDLENYYYEVTDKVKLKVKSWVVVNENSQIIGDGSRPQERPWFRHLKIHEVARAEHLKNLLQSF